MLDCKSHRLDYGTLLAPPHGYQLDRAIATTYSADLGALLSIPVALVYAHTLEGDLTGTRFQLLEAIKKFSRQVKVYHQMGQLHVPARLNWLHAYLEESLAPLLMSDPFSAFHPKLWIIRYTPILGSSKPCFRVIVLTRNLTFDRSWDIAAFLEGNPGKRPNEDNKPLVDFVRWLDRQDPIDGLEPFLEELSRVSFPTQEPFEHHAFHPLGIPGYKKAEFLTRKAKKALVLSPFLHEEALRKLRANVTRQLHVFSRKHELEKMPADLLEKLHSYHLDEQIVDGEHLERADDGDPDVQKQDLHAKLFMLGNTGECTWFLGSANATMAAVTKNIEFMLELKTTVSRARIQRTLNELIGEEDAEGPFVHFDPTSGDKSSTEEDENQAQSRRFEHALLNSAVKAWVTPSPSGVNYDLNLRFDLRLVKKAPDLVVTVQPFNTKQSFRPFRLTPGESCDCRFDNIGEVELSRFLHIRIEAKDGELVHEFLWRVDIDGLPTDRLENILRKIIDSPDKFFDYLRFLLADEISKEDILKLPEVGSEPVRSADDEAGSWIQELPIYEQLLVTAARSPGKLAEVDEIIQQLASAGDSSKWAIPETFLSFWEIFRAQIPPPSTPAKA